jgi:hypothetical protein
MKKTLFKTILPVLVASLVVGIVMAQIYTDTTPDNDETVKQIEKEYLVPQATSTKVIDMGKNIDCMNHKKKDMETIFNQWDNCRLEYNDGLTGIKSKSSPISEGTIDLPNPPEKILDIEK